MAWICSSHGKHLLGFEPSKLSIFSNALLIHAHWFASLFSPILLCVFLTLLIPGHTFLVTLPYPSACERLWQTKINDCPLMDYLYCGKYGGGMWGLYCWGCVIDGLAWWVVGCWNCWLNCGDICWECICWLSGGMHGECVDVDLESLFDLVSC